MTASLALRSVDRLPDPSGDGLLLRIVDDRLRVGWGEAVARPGFSRPLAELVSASTCLPSALVGRSLRSVEDAAALSAELRATDGDPLPSPLRFAVESALLDLLGQAAEVPVAELLGEPAARLSRNALVYAGAGTERITALRELGFSTFKVKARGPWPGSLRDLQALSLALGQALGQALGEPGEPGESGESSEPLRLRIDCNGSIPAGDAAPLLAGLAALSPEYVEEPIAGLEAAAWRDLARPGLRLAVDESAVDELAWRAHLEVAAAQIVVIKPAFVGGLFAALRRVREARARGLQVVITSALEGAIGTAAAAHLAFAIRPELAVGITARSGAPLPPWLRAEAPTIDRPRAPGLGHGLGRDATDPSAGPRSIGARR
jgi:L-alanine-DL-glutamate epimerase-like enolase superfamily enzyme